MEINFTCKFVALAAVLCILYTNLQASMESNSSSSQESTASKVPVIDAEGYTICPDCDSRINCGSVGLANLEKRHRGKKVCKAAQEKRDKAKTQNGRSILSFLKPKAAVVPPIVGSRAPIYGTRFGSQHLASPVISMTILQDKAVSPEAQPELDTGPIIDDVNIINTLKNLVDNLPECVPEASESDKLAVFGGSPEGFDNPILDADELWETTLNHVLKSALGWGTEGNMDEIIRRGKWGLGGLVNFAKYFVEKRGVSSVLFEGKLTNLVMALKKR